MRTITIKCTVMISILSTLFFPALIFSSESFAQNITTTSSSINGTKSGQLDASCELTMSTLQGPHYKEDSPLKKEFAKGIVGERIIITGKVFDFYDCKPIHGAILDFWQADSTGKYDNEGFDLRGKVISDLNGNYKLETIIPANETIGNRTIPAHIHLKAWIPDNPGDPVLDTQLYLGGDPNKDKFVKDQLILKPVYKNGTNFANFDIGLEDYRDYGEDYMLR
ncbi:MAG: hypothetical protein ACR2F1_14815 [Nitrososphaeraceae archaeon]